MKRLGTRVDRGAHTVYIVVRSLGGQLLCMAL
jgi:hypothetical protein